MAVQNDNTVVTKGDLKNLYADKIAPYLGANMQMSVGAKDYYSTDEKIVGVWTDGKPIYQKTLVYTKSQLYSGEHSYTHGIANIDRIWFDCTGSFLSVSGYYWTMQNSNADTYYFFGVWGNTANLSILISAGVYSSMASSDNMYVTIRYTKTTDTAGSATATPGAYDINFPNTWPENTEIYFGNGLYGYRLTGTQSVNNTESWYSFNQTVNGVTGIINHGGYIKRGNDRYAIPTTLTTGLTCTVAWDNSTNSFGFMARDTSASSWTFDMWVTYTK